MSYPFNNPDHCLNRASEQEAKSQDFSRSPEERITLEDSAKRWFKRAIELEKEMLKC